MTEKGKQSAMSKLLDYRGRLIKNAEDPSVYDDKKVEFPVVWVVGDVAYMTYNAALRAQREEDFYVDGHDIYGNTYKTKHAIEAMTWEYAFMLRNGRMPDKHDMRYVDTRMAQKGGIMPYEKYGNNVPVYQRDAYRKAVVTNN